MQKEIDYSKAIIADTTEDIYLYLVNEYCEICNSELNVKSHSTIENGSRVFDLVQAHCIKKNHEKPFLFDITASVKLKEAVS